MEEKKHSLLGPSSAHRRIKCAASYNAEKVFFDNSLLPQEESEYAIEGTKAHAVLEEWVNAINDPKLSADSIESIVRIAIMEQFGREDKAANQEHYEYVKEAIDYINYYRNLGYVVFAEQRLSMTYVHPESFGTGDIILYNPKTHHIIVADFKYGKGVQVKTDYSEEFDNDDIVLAGLNSQLVMYGYGAIVFIQQQLKNPTFIPSKITIAVIQPRYEGAESISEVEMDPIVLELEIEAIKQAFAVATSEEGKTQYKIGEHCRWCAAQNTCPAQQKQMQETVNQAFDMMPIVEKGASGQIATNLTYGVEEANINYDKLRKLWDQKKIVDQFYSKLNQFFYSLAEAGYGDKVGLALGRGRTTRSYPNDVVDAQTLVHALDVLGMRDVPQHICVEHKLLPQTRLTKELSKLFGKKEAESVMDKLLVKREGSPRLVDASSPDAITPQNTDEAIAKMFEGL